MVFNMVKKNIDWEGGAKLEDHTKKKHSILRKYFRQYLIIRCQLPQQEKFRLAIVDGFSGAGLYECGGYGSPLIFVEVLIETINEINLYRADQNLRSIQIECLLLLNDHDKSVITKLRQNISPLLVAADANNENLHIQTEYFNKSFEELYPVIKKRLQSAKCRNVLFNLDQCGYSHVNTKNIKDIVTSWPSAEVLLTFMITSMLAYI